VAQRDQSTDGARRAIHGHERHVQPRPIFPAEKAVARQAARERKDRKELGFSAFLVVYCGYSKALPKAPDLDFEKSFPV
jgi:hypothetical protein